MIKLVTYMRENEQFTDELSEVADMLYGIFGKDFEVILCCEVLLENKVLKPYPVRSYLCKRTKYQRLLSLLKEDAGEYFLSIDNDIKANLNELKEFVSIAARGELDIAWGRIQARQSKGLFGNLVALDKLLSHNILRPLLWKMGIGISIPGQCFWIKREVFVNSLPAIDTFLDDLALGLTVNRRQAALKMQIFPLTLGYETPNETFFGLWGQRKRWAKGYVSMLLGVNKAEDRIKVIFHGIAYHLMWIFSWIICIFLLHIHWIGALLYMGVLSFILGRKKFLYALLYQLIFPIFHLCWIMTVLKIIAGKNK